jgi:hypothetical protein
MRLGFAGATRPVVLEIEGESAASVAEQVLRLAGRWPRAVPAAATDAVLSDLVLDIAAYAAPQTRFDAPLAAANGAVGALIGALVVQQPEALALHAAAYRASAGMVVLLGDHGAGKSTLAAALATAGAPLACDDRLVVRRTEAAWQGLALGLVPKLRWPLPAEAPPAFADAVAALTVAAEGGMRLVDLPGVLDFGVTAPLAAIIAVQRDDAATGAPALVAGDRATLVATLVTTAFAPHMAPAARLPLLARLAALPHFTLRYRSAFDAAALLLGRYPP